MTRRPSEVEMLENTISALEQLILSAPDDEILSHNPEGIYALKDVRTLIARHLGDRAMPKQASRNSPERSQGRSRRAHGLPKAWSDRLAFLQRLAATRPDLSPRLGTVFSSRIPPTREELDKLIEELVKLGLLSKNDSKTE